ncbi:MAG: hypothetical protein AB7O37_16570 [Vicinamibacteria bacterium]
MTSYVAGPLFLVRAGADLRSGFLTVSHCLATVAPDTWAIEWVRTPETERLEEAMRCGIPAERLPSAVAWVTQRFDRQFAWSHVFLDREAAREFRRLFLPEDFRLLQIGLAGDAVDKFLAAAAPPPQQPGFAPNGATGVYQALAGRQALPPAADRGFEVLGYDSFGGGFDSFRCYAGLEQEFSNLGAAYNQWGLITDESVAVKCARLAAEPPGGTCADSWEAWRIVEHAL